MGYYRRREPARPFANGMNLKLHLLFLGLVLHLLMVRPASACSCGGYGNPAEAVSKADAVFIGTVDSIFLWSPSSLSSISRALVAEFTTSQVFKGPKRKKLYVSTGGGGAISTGPADCGFPFRAGRTYLVYAYGDGFSWRLDTSVCTRTALVADAEADIRYLRKDDPKPGDLPSRLDLSGYWEKQRSSRICGTVVWDAERYPEIRNFHLFLLPWENGTSDRQLLSAVKTADYGTYCTRGIEPGKYKIGGSLGNWNQNWLSDYFRAADNWEKAEVVNVDPDTDVQNINFNLRPLALHTIKGQVVLKGAPAIPPGTLTVTASNDWDSRLSWACKGIVREDGTFEISKIYPGIVRLSLSFDSDQPEDDGVWRAIIPEILIPEEAGNATIILERENFAGRVSRFLHTLYSYLLWDDGASME